MTTPRALRQRRNKGFDETHQELIETAVRLISDKGMEALSVAALAREMGINRTTVYYHFENREELLEAVNEWSSHQLAQGMELDAPQIDRIGHVSRFVLENPELIKLWIEGFVSGTDIRESYPCWDELVGGMRERLAEIAPDTGIDAEVFCLMQLTSAIIAPRVFRNSVRPDAPVQEVVNLFLNEHLRLLALQSLKQG